MYVCRGVGTGPADPATAGPKFALSIKIETHNFKKVLTVWKVLNYV